MDHRGRPWSDAIEATLSATVACSSSVPFRQPKPDANWGRVHL